MPTWKPPKGRKTHKRKVPRNPIAPLSVSVSTETTSPPRLLDRVRAAIRVRHFSPLTEKAYVGWIKRFIFFLTSVILMRWVRVRYPRTSPI